jgi:transcriptional regulator with XRE-family HTH domain
MLGINRYIIQVLLGSQGGISMCYEKNFPNRLAALRQEMKQSLQQVGDAVGVSNQAISLMEKGKSLPSFNVLCLLADYFGVSLDYLAGRSDKKERS